MPIIPPMQYTGLALTEGFEGKRNTAYWDPLGHCWTIGYGATGPGVIEGIQWTDQQCLDDLAQRFVGIASQLNRLIDVPVTQDEFNALGDFAYNVGIGSLQHSTLLRLLNAGNYKGAAEQFELWDHASGQVVAGLLRRRLAEANEFTQTGD